MPKVAVFTTVYNGQNYLERCIRSIQNQTSKDWIYFILDNGSTDNTWEILREYACKDKRIILWHQDINQICIDNKMLLLYVIERIKEYQELYKFEYMCVLDVDDEYSPQFIEKMKSFIKDNNLDIAMCGTCWINEETGETIKEKVVNENILLEGTDFVEYYPIYRNHIVTIWGGLYSLDFLNNCSFDWFQKAPGMEDTAFCLEAFYHARRGGIISECLHKYYISYTSFSYKRLDNALDTIQYIYDINKEYLLSYGPLSKINENYLFTLYLILVKYFLQRFMQNEAELESSTKFINQVILNENMKYLLTKWGNVGIYSDRTVFVKEILDWVKRRNITLQFEVESILNEYSLEDLL